jgi:pimeloyl-ACP methyl ester carboxylesterase
MSALLAYYNRGNGFPVVLLHGFCENKDIWDTFSVPLSEAFQVITPDMPGFGGSQHNTNFASVEAMANEVSALLQQLQIGKCVLIGHSLGGYVALALAEKHPEIVAGLALFHSTAYPDTEEKKQTRTKTADFIDKNGIPAFIENFVPPLFFKDRHEELKEYMELTRKITLQAPKATAVAVTKAMRDRPDRTHVLREATYPVLFIAGKDDGAVSFLSAKEQFFLPKHSQVQALAETGHMGMFERPQETYLMVHHFSRYCQDFQDKNSYAPVQ